MFDLVVEMTCEPVIEEGRLDVACAGQLHRDPVPSLVCVNVHGKMADLSAPHKPMAFQEPDEEVPAEGRPEAPQ